MSGQGCAGLPRMLLPSGCVRLCAFLVAAAAIPTLLAAQPTGEAPNAPDSAQGPAASEETPTRSSSEAEAERQWGLRWDEHPSIYFGRRTSISFTARFQADHESSPATIGDPSGFDLARRRLGVEGRIAGIVGFELDYELGDTDPWRDAYVEYRQFTPARIRAGQFKLPFSLDENTGATNLDFAYRSRAATQLAPGRDSGVMASGRVFELVRYEAGWFTHDGRNARTNNVERVSGDRTLAARVTVQPFRRSKSIAKDVHAGLAVTGSEVPEGFPALRGRTVLDAPLFTPDVWVRGYRRRIGFEARWRPGPFSIKSEYIRVSTERRGQAVDDTDLPPLLGTGWYVSTTWLATGERKADDPIRPRSPLFGGGIGAIELAGRVEDLAFGSDADPGEIASSSPRAAHVLGNSERAVTLGVNWYPYRGFKIQLNVIREAISDATRGPLPERPAFWSHVLRVQLAL